MSAASRARKRETFDWIQGQARANEIAVADKCNDLLTQAARSYDPMRHDEDSVFFDGSYTGPSERDLMGGCNRCGGLDDCYCPDPPTKAEERVERQYMRRTKPCFMLNYSPMRDECDERLAVNIVGLSGVHGLLRTLEDNGCAPSLEKWVGNELWQVYEYVDDELTIRVNRPRTTLDDRMQGKATWACLRDGEIDWIGTYVECVDHLHGSLNDDSTAKLVSERTHPWYFTATKGAHTVAKLIDCSGEWPLGNRG